MEEDNTWNRKKQIVIEQVANKVIYGEDIYAKIQGARDIRRLVRNSSAVRARSSFAAAGVIPALIPMLSEVNFEAREAALVALLNLAARNELYVFYLGFGLILCDMFVYFFVVFGEFVSIGYFCLICVWNWGFW